MICSSCSHTLSDGELFCKHCGTQVDGEGLDVSQEERQRSTQSVTEPVCPNCSQPVAAGARFCMRCGLALNGNHASTANPHKEGARSFEASGQKVLHNITHRINRVAGFDDPVELKLRDVFSKVLTKHTADEAEAVFIVGTSKTTPDIQDVAATWPKPWLFSRIFLFFAVAYAGMYLGVTAFHNSNALPGLIILGAVMVPGACLIFFWEMNAPQNISLYTVFQLFLIGGVLSLVVTLVFYQIAGNSAASTIVVGIVEELGKLVAVLWFVRRLNYKYILNGLLIGAAVGAGFAVFETAGYLLNHTDTLADFNNTMLWRSILAPGGHVVWAAMAGGALLLVKGAKPFTFSMLGDFRFLRILLIAIVLHAAWDGLGIQIGGIPIVQVIFMVLSWVIAFAIMGAGLRQVSQSKVQSSHRSGSADAMPGVEG